MRTDVPHDGEDDLEPLSNNGFESLVVLHTPLSACELVAVEFGLCLDKRVAEEGEWALELLVATL